jgi:carboxyl-terminal processing protease
MNLTLDDRTKIFNKVCRLVETKHFNPGMNGVDWNALVRDRRDQILACTDPETFEKEVHKLVAELKTSHTGFRHAGMRNIPARHAINATLQRIGINGSERWMFQDVHQGGPAFAAGIRPGDLVLECGGREVRPSAKSSSYPPPQCVRHWSRERLKPVSAPTSRVASEVE